MKRVSRPRSRTSRRSIGSEGDAEAMLEAAQLALAHARASGSRRSAAEAAPLIAYALHKGRVPLDEALERLDETRAQLDDDLLARTLLLLDEAMMLAAVGRQSDAKVATDRARDTFEDLGQRRWLEISKAAHAEIARREGKLERAEELLRSVYDFFRTQGDENNSLQIAFVLADVLCDLGRFDEADLLATLVAREGPPDDIEVQVSWRAVRSRTSAARGDPTGAVTLAEEAVSIAGHDQLRPAPGRGRARPRGGTPRGRPHRRGRCGTRGRARALRVEARGGARRGGARTAQDHSSSPSTGSSGSSSSISLSGISP